MSQVSEIQSLQELDDQGATYRAALESVEAKLRGDTALDEARRRLAAAAAELAPVKKDQVRVDSQLKVLTNSWTWSCGSIPPAGSTARRARTSPSERSHARSTLKAGNTKSARSTIPSPARTPAANPKS